MNRMKPTAHLFIGGWSDGQINVVEPYLNTVVVVRTPPFDPDSPGDDAPVAYERQLYIRTKLATRDDTVDVFMQGGDCPIQALIQGYTSSPTRAMR